MARLIPYIDKQQKMSADMEQQRDISPLFISAHDFSELPKGSGGNVRKAVLYLLQSDYLIFLNAKLIGKMNLAVSKIVDQLEKVHTAPGLSISKNEKKQIDSVTKAIRKSFGPLLKHSELYQFHSGSIDNSLVSRIRSALFSTKMLTEDIQATLSVSVSELRDDLRSIADVAGQTLDFIQKFHEHISNYSTYPKEQNLPENISVVTVEWSDDSGSAEIRCTRQKVQFGEQCIELEFREECLELGTRHFIETWSLNGELGRVAGLPSVVSVDYWPSAEDNDPSFNASHGVAFLNSKYVSMHEDFISRRLACDYVESDSDYYTEAVYHCRTERSNSIEDAVSSTRRPR